MAETYGFFNSVNHDRVYYAHDWANLISLFLTDGVKSGGSNLQVVADSSTFMQVQVRPGSAIIRGYYYHILDNAKNILVPPADATHPRIDRIVLRLDLNEKARYITADIKAGEPQAQPAAPPLTRTNAVWELGLATIQVKAGVTDIRQADITDTRLKLPDCGLIDSKIQADTTAIFDQLQDFYDQEVTNFDHIRTDQTAAFAAIQADFNSWYASAQFDIAALQNLDFDNLAAFIGGIKNTEFREDGSIIESIRRSSDGRIAATREAVFGTTDVTVTTTHYQDDGTTIKQTATITTTFNADGTITEVIN